MATAESGAVFLDKVIVSRSRTSTVLETPNGETDSPDWNDPQPLSIKEQSKPYPIDALPDVIRMTVNEVAEF